MRRSVVALLMLAGLLLPGCSGTTTSTTSPAASPSSARPAAADGVSGLPTVNIGDLPPEARSTYTVIQKGGPYPYPQDDEVFGNREGLLPAQDYGWYREYTVQTPGSGDRGARRFVVGSDAVYFYTDDHYDSFSEVMP